MQRSDLQTEIIKLRKEMGLDVLAYVYVAPMDILKMWRNQLLDMKASKARLDAVTNGNSTERSVYKLTYLMLTPFDDTCTEPHTVYVQGTQRLQRCLDILDARGVNGYSVDELPLTEPYNLPYRHSVG